jgi:hypothetical protein
MIYFIYDQYGLIRKVKSKSEAEYLVSLRPDWKIVAKRVPKKIVVFEDAPF